MHRIEDDMVLIKRIIGIVFISFSSMNALQRVATVQRVEPISVHLHELLEQAHLLQWKNLPLMQAKVFDQGPTAASCGYLALSNGLNLVTASGNGSIELLLDMDSSDYATRRTNEWRLIVRKSRLKPKITNYLTRLIMANYYQTCSSLSPELQSSYSGSKKFNGCDCEQQAKEKVAGVIKRICGALRCFKNTMAHILVN